MLTLVLLIFALACFLLAAFNIGGARVNLIGLGLALWVLTELIPQFDKV
ncbi:hypothetical protein Acor_01370 [Acrocarpospora corrugata]|uniref:Uncharacterized protein n=1 Tax=Acrocarpospora corrugata TaxID=35763 RepID=A0A5M3VN48_9ACTN|nr:hypothetical protein [Acrocarpospora corrugata]GER98075.1 hypothetical protein Acor_01370 [Acrocarpospora corrugata]